MKLSNLFTYFFADKLAGIWKNQSVSKMLALAFFFSVVFMTLFSSLTPQQVSLRIDEVSKNDIVSEINAVVIDEKQTAELRQQAASRVQKVYQRTIMHWLIRAMKLLPYMPASRKYSKAAKPPARTTCRKSSKRLKTPIIRSIGMTSS